MRTIRARQFGQLALVALMILAGMFAGIAEAQEVCGLQTASFDIIFANGFDSALTGVGPASGTVNAPTLGVTPTITITYPPPATTLVGGKVQVTGTVTGSVDTGVEVNNVRAYIYNGQFLTPPISIDSSTNTLNAQATTLDGLTATASVTVAASAGDPGATLTPGRLLAMRRCRCD